LTEVLFSMKRERVVYYPLQTNILLSKERRRSDDKSWEVGRRKWGKDAPFDASRSQEKKKNFASRWGMRSSISGGGNTKVSVGESCALCPHPPPPPASRPPHYPTFRRIPQLSLPLEKSSFTPTLGEKTRARNANTTSAQHPTPAPPFRAGPEQTTSPHRKKTLPFRKRSTTPRKAENNIRARIDEGKLSPPRGEGKKKYCAPNWESHVKGGKDLFLSEVCGFLRGGTESTNVPQR